MKFFYPNTQQSNSMPLVSKMRSILFIALALTSLNIFASGGGGGDPSIADGQANYYTIEPAIVVNVLDGRGMRYLQVAIDVMSMDSKAIEAMQNHQAPIRHELIMLFAHRDISEVLGLQQREQLRQEALSRIRETLLKYADIKSNAKAKNEEGKKYPLGIQEVLFTSFVIQ